MSLTDKIAAADPRRRNLGCVTCKWFAKLPAQDQKSFIDWIDNGFSIRQLHSMCRDNDPPLDISPTAFKNHVRDCLGYK